VQADSRTRPTILHAIVEIVPKIVGIDPIPSSKLRNGVTKFLNRMAIVHQRAGRGVFLYGEILQKAI